MNNKYAMSKSFGADVMQFDGSFPGYQDLKKWIDPLEIEIFESKNSELTLMVTTGNQNSKVLTGHYVVLFPWGGYGVFAPDAFAEHLKIVK